MFLSWDQKWLGWLLGWPWKQILWPSIYNGISRDGSAVGDRRSNPTGTLYTSPKCLSYTHVQEQYNAMEMANRVLRCTRSSPTALQRAGGWGAQLFSGRFPLAGPSGNTEVQGSSRDVTEGLERKNWSPYKVKALFFPVFVFSATLGTSS